MTLPEDARFWWEVLRWALTLAVAAWVFLWKRQMATQEHIRATAERLAARLEAAASEEGARAARHAERLTRLEALAASVPSQGDVRELVERLGSLEGDVKRLSALIESTAKQLDGVAENVAMLVRHEMTAAARRGGRSQ